MGPDFTTDNIPEGLYVDDICLGEDISCYDSALPSSDSSDSSLSPDDLFLGRKQRRRYYSDEVPEKSVTQSEERGLVGAGRAGRAAGRRSMGDVAYQRRRERNNEAVRRSRTKARMKQAESETRLRELGEENRKLRQREDLLLKELSLLRGLFPSSPSPGTPNQLMVEVDTLLAEAGVQLK